MPFLVAGVSGIHLFYLHSRGSNNPLGVRGFADAVPFHQYYSAKDASGFAVLLTCLIGLVLFSPALLVDAENFIPANPLLTPAHIVPE